MSYILIITNFFAKKTGLGTDRAYTCIDMKKIFASIKETTEEIVRGIEVYLAIQRFARISKRSKH